MNKKVLYFMPAAAILILAAVFAFSGNKKQVATQNAAPKIGEMAPEILLKDKDGKEIALSSLKGKIVLVDFWASWCNPCRKENPNLVKAYDKYHNANFKTAKEFVIYSVSLDSDVKKWDKAVKADKLDWPYHVSDLMGWDSPVAMAWGVESIPSNFLLDETGKVVAINLRGKDLEDALKVLQE